MLTAGNPAALEGSLWVDLYAGTGAVGIEALSRGAASVCFVESSAAAVKVIYQNLASLQITSGFEIIHADVLKALPSLEAGSPPADYVFLDPPYCLGQAYADTLDLLAKSPLLKRESIVMAEHQKKLDLQDRFDSLIRYRTLGQGDAALSFYRPG